MPSLRKASLPGSCSLPEQLRTSPSRHPPRGARPLLGAQAGGLDEPSDPPEEGQFSSFWPVVREIMCSASLSAPADKLAEHIISRTTGQKLENWPSSGGSGGSSSPPAWAPRRGRASRRGRREGDVLNCSGKLHDPGKLAFRRLGILPQQL